MAVAMGLVPTKGLTLPFVSYGGCSLIVLMGASGLLLSVSSTSEGARRRVAQKTTRTATRESPIAGAGVPA
jgi:cell division protein FtsW